MKIVYWSGSGNTEKMANLIAQGIKENGVETQVIDVSHNNIRVPSYGSRNARRK